MDSSLEEKVKVMVAVAVMKTKVGMKRYTIVLTWVARTRSMRKRTMRTRKPRRGL